MKVFDLLFLTKMVRFCTKTVVWGHETSNRFNIRSHLSEVLISTKFCEVGISEVLFSACFLSSVCVHRYLENVPKH